jgi:surface antigen
LEVNNETNELLIEDMNYKAKFVVTQRYISQTDSNIIWYIY